MQRWVGNAYSIIVVYEPTKDTRPTAFWGTHVLNLLTVDYVET